MLTFRRILGASRAWGDGGGQWPQAGRLSSRVLAWGANGERRCRDDARSLAFGIAIASCLACLAACGQKGTLFLPTEAAAANRATLPQSLRPLLAPSPQPGSSAAGAAGAAATTAPKQ